MFRDRITGKEVLEDGEAITVDLAMMDSAQRALHDGFGREAGHGGYVFKDGVDFSEADKAQAEYEDRITNAWRNPAQQATPESKPRHGKTLYRDAEANLDAAYDAHDKAVSEAWKAGRQ